MSASSPTVDGSPANTSTRIEPTEFATRPLSSGVPIVREPDAWTGGVQAGKASGGPWMRFGVVHELKAGTSAKRSGVAPLGRGKPPVAACTVVSAVAELS